jgi:hypothetical protein
MMKGENGMQTQNAERIFWPNGARLAVSISMMFGGGGQPISGAGGPIPEPVKDGLRDLPTNAFFAYGYYEGIPRALRAQSSEPAPCQMHAQLFQQLPLTGDAVQIAQQQNA